MDSEKSEVSKRLELLKITMEGELHRIIEKKIKDLDDLIKRLVRQILIEKGIIQDARGFKREGEESC